jgi:hypothetical protein
MKLAELSQEAHQSDDEPEQLERIQSAIDELAASVWGLQPSSFVALREIMDGVISPGSISHVP